MTNEIYRRAEFRIECTAALTPAQMAYRKFFRKRVKDDGLSHPFELQGVKLKNWFKRLKKDYRNYKRRNEYQEHLEKYTQQISRRK